VISPSLNGTKQHLVGPAEIAAGEGPDLQQPRAQGVLVFPGWGRSRLGCRSRLGRLAWLVGVVLAHVFVVFLLLRFHFLRLGVIASATGGEGAQTQPRERETAITGLCILASCRVTAMNRESQDRHGRETCEGLNMDWGKGVHKSLFFID